MGKEFNQSVVISSSSAVIGAGSIDTEMIVGASIVTAKVGGAKLAGRTSVTLCAHPDNTGYIYIGLDVGLTTANYFYVLAGGAGIEIDLKATDALDVYLLGSAAGQRVGVLEGIG